MNKPGDTRNLLERFPALKRLGRFQQRIPFIQQVTATDCGAACLNMVLAYHGKVVRRDEIRSAIGVGRDGANAKDILVAARRFGLRARGARVELEAFEYLPVATVLHWSFNHFVVFESATRKGITILDPGLGRRFVPMTDVSRQFTGIVLLLEPTAEFQRGGEKDNRSAWLLGRLLWQSGDWSRILTVSIFLQVLVLALPLLTGTIVDRVIPRGDEHLLLVLGVGLAGITLFQLVASLLRSHLLLELRTLLDVRMTLDFLGHLTSLPYAFFQQRPAGDLMMRLNSNTLIRDILTSTTLSGLLDGALICLYVFALVFASPAMGGLVFVLAALQAVVFLATRRKQHELNALHVERQVRSQSYQVEMFGGMETLKAMGCETHAEEHWTGLFVDVQNAALSVGRMSATVEAVTNTLRLAGPLVILGLGTSQVLHGAMSMGTMLAINTFAMGVMSSSAALVNTAVQLQLLGTYLERITDVQETAPEQDLTKVRPAGVLSGRIALRDVQFRYGPMEPLVVDGVSVRIEPGQLVALVGRSGSGKSTLASLLLGLHAPVSGQVFYDDMDLRELDLRSVRKQLGIVTQRTHLFGGSIRDNIALSDPVATFEQVVEAGRLAQVHDEIMQMPMGYETVLVDGGVSLSGGQRQRIALARALLNKPAVLLLDEATSALDAITEKRVQDAVSALQATRIVIAHRLSTVVSADVILVLDGGKLVEQGTHAELVARGGFYAQLVAAQLAVEAR